MGRDRGPVAVAVGELRKLAPERPWLTARGIARRAGLDISSAAMEQALLDHAQGEGRALRYSYYPSKKTLELLWGHVDRVGEHDGLPRPDRTDIAEDYEQDSRAFDRWCFLSHNQHDARAVAEIRDRLAREKVGSWMFQAEIQEGEMITDSVRDGLAQCQAIIGYVSRHSLSSIWVRKELEAAGLSFNLPVMLVLDGRDAELLRLVHQVRTGAAWRLSLAGLAPMSSTNRREKWQARADEFLHSLSEYLGQSIPPLVYPDPEPLSPGGDLDAPLLTTLRLSELIPAAGAG